MVLVIDALITYVTSLFLPLIVSGHDFEMTLVLPLYVLHVILVKNKFQLILAIFYQDQYASKFPNEVARVKYCKTGKFHDSKGLEIAQEKSANMGMI